MRSQVPILDEAYMQRRADQERFRYQMERIAALHAGVRAPKDNRTSARDAYLAGEITAEAFEIRLNTAFGLPAYHSVRPA